MPSIKDRIQKLLEENNDRIQEYKDNGGEDHNYLDGKSQAFEEVLNILSEEFKTKTTQINTNKMRITLNKNSLDNNKGSGGLEINILGCKGNPTDVKGNGQVFIEYHEGKVKVHVWNGTEDCQTLIIESKKR